MKTKLLKAILFVFAFAMFQTSFAQLVNVPLSNATAGLPHYTNGTRDVPSYNIDDTFAYDPSSPTTPYPNCNASNTDNYYLTQNVADQNWWACEVAIPSGKSLKYLDFYGRDGKYTNSGQLNRWRNLTITLSDGVNTEVKTWAGIADATAADDDPKNYAQMDFAAQEFSSAMLQNATSIRLDLNSTAMHLEFMEMRLSADTTLGTDDFSATSIVVSPNPVRSGEQLTINLSNSNTQTLEVYSIVGALLYQTKVYDNVLSLDYSIFPSSGLYLVKVGSAVSKILVE
ncbi:T9SS type A sorting domain-containing protein [Tamlana fucoidanivorans]|uniref:T9SS type A sorting domain-containing protein n=1 Tax=Allotamlana fucoidanivorans TaxID=2583814 RepID=A0A5C4SPQ2_9FLAO|nr:T9SS type A sorting domain-containing protein [Tamlana fucoidanivorans]TNJ45860.1 T9SS type A sorting domain-containing protein [Tamlana fucoidanivorans]